MRICFLCGDISKSGGTERMMTWLAGVLCETHQVHILSLRNQWKDAFFPVHEAVSVQVLPPFSGKLSVLRQIRWIHRYLQENHIDRVINVDVGMGFYGIWAAKGTGARVITWEHGNYYNNWGSRLFPHIRRHAARKSHALVVLTKRDQENYHRNIPGCAPVYAIHNPAKMQPKQDHSENRIILSVGHLLENKGFHRAVEVAAKILPRHPDWQWIICGEGPERERLEQQIRAAGLENQVKLPGLIKDMQTMYRQAALLVLTSTMEGLSMALLEGKSWGLPLVSFDIMTGPSDIIDHGVNGFLVESFDLDEMARRLEQLMDDPVLREEMSRNAVLGMENFSEETILAAWQKVMEEI